MTNLKWVVTLQVNLKIEGNRLYWNSAINDTWQAHNVDLIYNTFETIISRKVKLHICICCYTLLREEIQLSYMHICDRAKCLRINRVLAKVWWLKIIEYRCKFDNQWVNYVSGTMKCMLCFQLQICHTFIYVFQMWISHWVVKTYFAVLPCVQL